MLDAMHEALLREHGGAPGVRDSGLLDSALARPRHKFIYAKAASLATLAASYLYGLAKNHGFVDGNKRVALMAAYAFLGLNGRDLDAGEPEVADVVDGVAAGRITERALASWLRARMRPLGRKASRA